LDTVRGFEECRQAASKALRGGIAIGIGDFDALLSEVVVERAGEDQRARDGSDGVQVVARLFGDANGVDDAAEILMRVLDIVDASGNVVVGERGAACGDRGGSQREQDRQ
jgi:hypothetical protein